MEDNERDLLYRYVLETKKEKKATNFIIKWLITLLVVTIICLALQLPATLFYLYQYDFSSEVTTTTTVDQDAGDGGNANYIGGNGDITNGKAEDSKNSNSEKNP